jgi:hypothetical protein
MNRKYYTFDRLPGVTFCQRELSYPELVSILDNFSAFIESLEGEKDLISHLLRFAKTNLAEMIATFITPGADTNIGLIKNFYFNKSQKD